MSQENFRWYYSQNGNATGPVDVDFLIKELKDGKLSLIDLVFREGDAEWHPMTEYEVFREAFDLPTRPDFQMDTSSRWIILSPQSKGPANEPSKDFVQSGPFSQEEILKMIGQGRIEYSHFAWKPGYQKWSRIGSLPEFDRRRIDRDQETEDLSGQGAQGRKNFHYRPKANQDNSDLLKNVVHFDPKQKFSAAGGSGVHPEETFAGHTSVDLNSHSKSENGTHTPYQHEPLVSQRTANQSSAPLNDKLNAKEVRSESIVDPDSPYAGQWAGTAHTIVANLPPDHKVDEEKTKAKAKKKARAAAMSLQLESPVLPAPEPFLRKDQTVKFAKDYANLPPAQGKQNELAFTVDADRTVVVNPLTANSPGQSASETSEDATQVHSQTKDEVTQQNDAANDSTVVVENSRPLAAAGAAFGSRLTRLFFAGGCAALGVVLTMQYFAKPTKLPESDYRPPVAQLAHPIQLPIERGIAQRADTVGAPNGSVTDTPTARRGESFADKLTAAGQVIIAPRPPNSSPAILEIVGLKLNSAKPYLVFQTDAQVGEKINVHLSARSGEILEWPSYEGIFELSRAQGEVPTLDLGKLGLPIGEYNIQASLGSLSRTVKLFVGVNDQSFVAAKEHFAKQIAYEQIWERRTVYYSAKRYENLARYLQSAYDKFRDKPQSWRKFAMEWKRQAKQVSPPMLELFKERRQDLAFPIEIDALHKAIDLLQEQYRKFDVAISQSRDIAATGVEPVDQQFSRLRRQASAMTNSR